MNLSETIGERIRRIRLEKGLSVNELQRRSGSGNISLYEKGQRGLTESTVEKIANGLGIDNKILFEVYKRQSRRGMNIEERFWDQVEKTDSCWLWKSRTNWAGYGRFSVGRVEYQAHRIAWTLVNGDIPSKAVIHHKCRNRLCVNPDHLEVIENNSAHLRMRNDNLLNEVFGDIEVKGVNK